ncbi:DegT/DnrJ/EryC1/StrS family aminotransferase [bacterium]|nr:DegT/DnrJ/EryC1/StrS family aminotransferase [bacterium]
MEKIYVTRPLLPDFDEFMKLSKEIFESKHLTNMGPKHNLLEEKLKGVLDVSNVSLFNNGTIALIVALKALDLPLGSEVITTPFTFSATPHSIMWCGLKPVFCDVEKDLMTIDTSKIEALITPKTSAILGVHVYGFPCNVEKIEKIAKKHNLKVIYDAAHAFCSEIDNKGIGNFGDITMFSFHATKLFNSVEGGALTYNDPNLASKIYSLRNFGIKNESQVEYVGINGKMNEFCAAFGLLNLEKFQKERLLRKKIKEFYDSKISQIKGIRIPKMPSNVQNSYQYYPIIIEDEYELSRDELYEKFKQNDIFTRKYFYPACVDYDCYEKTGSFDVLDDIKNRVLCLPYYGELTEDDLNRIVGVF